MDDLFWTPHRRLYQTLHAANRATQHSLKEDLEKHYDWLLSNVSKFKPCSGTSRKAITDSTALIFKTGKIGVDQRLKHATLELAKLLVSPHDLLCNHTVYNTPR